MMKQTPHHYLTIFLLLLLLHGIMGCQPGTQEAITPQPVDLAYSATTHPIETPITNAEAEEAVTIVAFPGLTDTTGPTSLTRMLCSLPGINPSPIIITRPSENEDIRFHAMHAYEELIKAEFFTKNNPLLLVAESYGVLIAYAMAKYNDMRGQYSLNSSEGRQLNIKGIISIHGPWQGVQAAAGIYGRYQQLQSIGGAYVLEKCLNRFGLGDYMIPKPLADLDPNGYFPNMAKQTLKDIDFPILAIAGSNEGRFGNSLYNPIREAYNSSGWKSKLLSFVFMQPIERIIQAYDKGNDGLITTESALATGFTKNANFTCVQAEAPHIHSDFSLYPILVKAASMFTQENVLSAPSSSTASGVPEKAYIAIERYVSFKGLKDAQGNPIPVPKYKMVSPKRD